MNDLFAAFKSGSVDAKGGAYSFWENAVSLDLKLDTVPLTLEGKEKKSIFNYGSNGYRFFHPFFLLDKNPASCDDYFHVVIKILSAVDDTFNREEYVFFRGDVNIVMMWIRVSFVGFPFYCFVFSRWYGHRIFSVKGLLWSALSWSSSIITRS